MPNSSPATRLVAGSSRAGSLLLAVLVCLGFFAFWIRDLGYPSFSGDESFVALQMSRPMGETLQRLNVDEPHPPAYYLVMRAWDVFVGGRLEFLVRFPSLLIGLLLLSLTYRLGRDLGLGWPAALAAVVWLGFDPQLTLHTRQARMYVMMIAGVAAAVLIGWRFERLPRRGAIWIAAAASLTALLTQYFNAVFVLVLSVWGSLVFEGGVRRRWILSQAVAWGLFAVWLPLMGRGFFNPSNLAEGRPWAFTLPPWDSLAGLVRTGAFGYRDIPDVWLTFAGGSLLVGGWLAGSLHGQRRQRLLLLLPVGVPLVTYAMLGSITPIYHPKYMLPWLLFAALALGSLMDRRRWLGSGVVVGLLALMALPTWQTVLRPYDTALTVSRGDWLRPTTRQVGQFLVDHAGPTDIFGMGSPSVTDCYYTDHYFDRRLGCALIPEYPTQPLDDLKRQIDDLLSEHAVLWYLDYYNAAWDPGRVADEALAGSALSLGSEETGGGGRLRLYTAADTVLRGQQRIGARFGEFAELRGIWITPGGSLHVVLVWRGLAEQPAVPAKVFVHLIDSGGQVVAQQDGVPVHWTRPIETWHLDEQLLDVYALPLPPGTRLDNMQLRVGLYDPDTAVRLPAYDRDGARLPEDAVAVSLADWRLVVSEAAR